MLRRKRAAGSATLFPNLLGFPSISFMDTIVHWIVTIIDVIEDHEAAITAIATVFLAVFTWRLWVSTNKLWGESRAASTIAKTSADAAKKAAEVAESALLNVERPYLLITASAFNIGAKTTDGTGSFYHPTIRYSVSNHGKLPAIIEMVYAEIIHAPDEQLSDPLSVDATDPLLMERVIESNGWRQNLVFQGCIAADVVNRADLTDFEIFFWIKINYHGPFTKGHQTSACWRLSFEQIDKLTLIQYGEDNYNYTK